MLLRKRFDRLAGDKNPSLAALIGVALAIEREAAQRYDALAESMALHRNGPVAALFRRLAVDERQHETAIQKWTAARGVTPEVPYNFSWVSRIGMPAASLADAGGPFLMTPRRALALAVLKEERAFAYYTAIAADAADADVRQQAEAFAKEELDHVAMLRLARRRAYRAESKPKAPIVGATPSVAVATLDDFLRLAVGVERATAEVYHAISNAPVPWGQTAALLMRLEGEALARSDELALELASSLPLAALGGLQQRYSEVSPSEAMAPLELLRLALQQAEEAFETYSAVAQATPDEAVMLHAEVLAEHAVEHIFMLVRELARAIR